jgi:hypothetical protein
MKLKVTDRDLRILSIFLPCVFFADLIATTINGEPGAISAGALFLLASSLAWYVWTTINYQPSTLSQQTQMMNRYTDRSIS